MIAVFGAIGMFIWVRWASPSAPGIPDTDFRFILKQEVEKKGLKLLKIEEDGYGPFPKVKVRIGAPTITFGGMRIPTEKFRYRKLTVENDKGEEKTLWAEIRIGIGGRISVTFKPPKS